MDRIFQIGDFTFRLICPEEVTPPDNFMLFACDTEPELHCIPEYTYIIEVSEELPAPEGEPAAQRPDLTVFRNGIYETRLIGVT